MQGLFHILNARNGGNKNNNVGIKMSIDIIALINLIDESTFALINKTKPIPLRRKQTELFAYSSKQQLPVMGKFETTVETKKPNHCFLYSYGERQL